jgi:hypothetical protein
MQYELHREDTTIQTYKKKKKSESLKRRKSEAMAKQTAVPLHFLLQTVSSASF